MADQMYAVRKALVNFHEGLRHYKGMKYLTRKEIDLLQELFKAVDLWTVVSYEKFVKETKECSQCGRAMHIIRDDNTLKILDTCSLCEEHDKCQ